MSHAFHLPAAAWIVLAPAATIMLANDLRQGIASSRYRSVARSAHPVQFRMITCLNMFVVALAWYEFADLLARWAG